MYIKMLKCLIIAICAGSFISTVFCAPGYDIREKQSWQDRFELKIDGGSRTRRQNWGTVDIEFIDASMIDSTKLNNLQIKELSRLIPVNDPNNPGEDFEIRPETNTEVITQDSSFIVYQIKGTTDACNGNQDCTRGKYPNSLRDDSATRDFNYNNQNYNFDGEQYSGHSDDRIPLPQPPQYYPSPYEEGSKTIDDDKQTQQSVYKDRSHHDGNPPLHRRGWPSPQSSYHGRRPQPHHQEGPPPPHHGRPPPPYNNGPPPPHHHEGSPPHHGRPPPHHEHPPAHQGHPHPHQGHPPPHHGHPPPPYYGGLPPPHQYEGPPPSHHRRPSPPYQGGPPHHGGSPERYDEFPQVQQHSRPHPENRNPPDGRRPYDNRQPQETGNDNDQKQNQGQGQQQTTSTTTESGNDDDKYLLDVRFADNSPTQNTIESVKSKYGEPTTTQLPVIVEAGVVKPED